MPYIFLNPSCTGTQPPHSVWCVALCVVTVGSGVKAPPPPPPRVSTAGVSSGCKPSIGSLSAAWPGVIFPSSASRKHTRDETTQVQYSVLQQMQHVFRE